MCHIIFKHMSNLSHDQRVQKYIHPSLKPTYHRLQDKAYIRHVAGYFTTSIDYTQMGITLLYKIHVHSPRTEVDTEKPGNDCCSSRIPQTDGNDSIMSDHSEQTPPVNCTEPQPSSQTPCPRRLKTPNIGHL